MNKQTLGFIFALTILILMVLFGVKDNGGEITNFEDCAREGNPVMESYPRQCRSKDGSVFTENIGNEMEKFDMIRINSPRPNETIKSPLVILGEARGMWFFEGDFPVVLTDRDGKIIAEGYATANPSAGGDWMTEDFVPFAGVLEFERPEFIGAFSKKGTLMLKKDNPSGLPEFDDALEIPVFFAGNNSIDGFAAFDSGIRGTVLVGPQCPVVREGEECPDKPYDTTVDILRSGSDSVFVTLNTDKNGHFEASLPPGAYTVRARGGSPLPVCAEKDVTTDPSGFIEVLISCDSGIR